MPNVARGLPSDRGSESAYQSSVHVLLRVALLWSALLAAGCGSEAVSLLPRATPIVEAIKVGDIARDAVALPNEDRSIKFAIIGDSGRGSAEQHAVAAQMVAYRQRFDYRFVLMAGDNIYEGPATAEDYRLKFEEPYQLLLDAGVRFFAVLGNHDDPQQIHYRPFNMDGRRYYTFTPPVDLVTRLDTRVRFFALDSTRLDGEQLAWLEKELQRVAGRVEDRPAALPALHLRPLRLRGARLSLRARIGIRARRGERRLLGPRALLPALAPAARHPVLRDRRGRLTACG